MKYLWLSQIVQALLIAFLFVSNHTKSNRIESISIKARDITVKEVILEGEDGERRGKLYACEHSNGAFLDLYSADHSSSVAIATSSSATSFRFNHQGRYIAGRADSNEVSTAIKRGGYGYELFEFFDSEAGEYVWGRIKPKNLYSAANGGSEED